MSRAGRRIVIIVAVVLAAIALVGLLLPLLVPKERIRTWAVARAEQRLGRPVAVSSVAGGLLPSPWVKLKGVELGEAPGQPRWRLSVETVTLKLRLLPLLSRRVEVTEVGIDRPALEIVLAEPAPVPAAPDAKTAPQAPSRAVSAEISRQGAEPPPGRTASAPEGSPASTAPQSPGSSPLDVQIRQLHVRDGSVHVRHPDGRAILALSAIAEDLVANLSREGRIELVGETRVDSLALHLPAGTLGRGLTLRLRKNLLFDTVEDRLSISEATLELGELAAAVTGEVVGISAGAPVGDLQVSGGPMNVNDILGYMPRALLASVEGVCSEGTLSLNAVVRGPLGSGPEATRPSAWFSVDLALTEGRIHHPQLAAPVEGITLRVHVGPDTLAIREFAAYAGDSRVQARATVTSYDSEPHVTATVDVDVDLKTVAALQAPGDSLRLSGRVAGHLVVSGSTEHPDAMRVIGTVRLSSVAVTAPQVPVPLRDVDADLELRERELIIHDIGGSFGSSDIRGSGRIENYSALDPRRPSDRAAAIDLDVRSRRLDLDELLTRSAEAGDPAGGDDGPPPAEAPPPAAVLANMVGTIVLQAGEILYNRVQVRDVKGTVHLDRGRITLERATGSAFGGSLAADGGIDLRSPEAPRFDVRIDARDVQAGQLFGYAPGLGRFGQLGGYLSGRIDVTASMQGELTDSLALRLDTFSSEGTLKASEARISRHPVQLALAEFLEQPRLEHLAISDWLQPFRIHDGRVTMDGMRLTAGEFELRADGWQALDGSIEIALDLLLPQELSAGVRRKVPAVLAPLLFDGPDGRVLLPLTVSGRLPQPRVALDEEQLRVRAQRLAEERFATERERLEKEALRQAADWLQGLSGAEADTSQKSNEEQREDLEKKAKSLLESLFKKKP